MRGTGERAAQVTEMLARAGRGEARATDELFPVVYQELRQLAEQHPSRESAGHTLQPTALVHEASVRMVGPREIPWENRAHFFGAAAQAIRRILIDHARSMHAQKRGGAAQRVGAGDVPEPTGLQAVDVPALDDALGKPSAMDLQKARVVELRFFPGLSVQQTAAAMGISERTAAREWEFARVWLFKELNG